LIPLVTTLLDPVAYPVVNCSEERPVKSLRLGHRMGFHDAEQGAGD
jgi:hypothetical protein